MSTVNNFVNRAYGVCSTAITEQFANKPQLAYRTAVAALTIFMIMKECSAPVVLFTAAALSPAVGGFVAALVVFAVATPVLAKGIVLASFPVTTLGLSSFGGLYLIKDLAQKLRNYSAEPVVLKMFEKKPEAEVSA
jgi:hypothetical protein